MSKESNQSLTEEERESYIQNLTNELTTLRTQACLSQEELAAIIGVSRQTYGTIERKLRMMSWDTYLALIMFFDYHNKTHDLLRSLGCFPYEIIKRFNNNIKPSTIDLNAVSPIDTDTLMSTLDEQALNNIKMIIMIEYARCTKTAGETIIKSFDGISFSHQTESNNVEQDSNKIKRRGRPRKNSRT